MSDETIYRTNGHEFAVLEDYGGDELIECQKCLIRDVITEGGEEHIVQGCTCHIEWLRQPNGGFRGVALRNGWGFSGRELIAVDERGEVTDTVRVYDDDGRLLSRLLGQAVWQRQEVDGDEEGDGGE